MDTIEIWACQWVVKRLRKGYGCHCETYDLDDFPELYNSAKSVFSGGRCASCRCKEVVEWLEEHIRLLQWSNSE